MADTRNLEACAGRLDAARDDELIATVIRTEGARVEFDDAMSDALNAGSFVRAYDAADDALALVETTVDDPFDLIEVLEEAKDMAVMCQAAGMGDDGRLLDALSALHEDLDDAAAKALALAARERLEKASTDPGQADDEAVLVDFRLMREACAFEWAEGKAMAAQEAAERAKGSWDCGLTEDKLETLAQSADAMATQATWCQEAEGASARDVLAHMVSLFAAEAKTEGLLALVWGRGA